jgi:hypothetical protein
MASGDKVSGDGGKETTEQGLGLGSTSRDFKIERRL